MTFSAMHGWRSLLILLISPRLLVLVYECCSVLSLFFLNWDAPNWTTFQQSRSVWLIVCGPFLEVGSHEIPVAQHILHSSFTKMVLKCLLLIYCITPKNTYKKVCMCEWGKLFKSKSLNTNVLQQIQGFHRTSKITLVLLEAIEDLLSLCKLYIFVRITFSKL